MHEVLYLSVCGKLKENLLVTIEVVNYIIKKVGCILQ